MKTAVQSCSGALAQVVACAFRSIVITDSVRT